MEFKSNLFSLYVPKSDGVSFNIVKEVDGKKYYLCTVDFDQKENVFICDWKLSTDANSDEINHNSDFEDFQIYNMLKLRKVKLYIDDNSGTDQSILQEKARLQLKTMLTNADTINAELFEDKKLIRINCKFEDKNIEAFIVIDSDNFIGFINKFSDDVQVNIFEEISKDKFNSKLYDDILKKSIESYYKNFN